MNRCILVTGVFLFLLSAGLFASDIDKYYAKKEYISPRRDTLRYRVLEPERIKNIRWSCFYTVQVREEVTMKLNWSTEQTCS